MLRVVEYAPSLHRRTPRYTLLTRVVTSRVYAGTGESIPAQESCAVALVAAQSFHWMSSAATLREVHRVLVPGGLFALVWNTRDYSRDWVWYETNLLSIITYLARVDWSCCSAWSTGSDVGFFMSFDPSVCTG